MVFTPRLRRAAHTQSRQDIRPLISKHGAEAEAVVLVAAVLQPVFELVVAAVVAAVICTALFKLLRFLQL
jgi:hypothetical protein